VRPIRGLPLAILFALAGASAVHAQEASIAGTVTDETKAVLPGATVTVTDLASGALFTAASNERGEYQLPTVPPGAYKVQAELSGFSTVVLARVELLVGQHAAIPLC